MQERHKDRILYFSEQEYTTSKYVIPFINNFLPINSDVTVLEIGCGEGGNLKPFLDLGCKCVGIDLNQFKIDAGKHFFENHPNAANLELIAENIYDINQANFQFDLVIMRDVIEHIPHQDKFMEHLKKFVKPNGKIFFAFPPWQNPFGGHQQICKSKISFIPFIHLLPENLYKSVLQIFEGNNILQTTNRSTVDELLDVKRTGITIERFRKVVKNANYFIEKEEFYFINPNYEVKFKLKPRKLFRVLGAIPHLRNFYTTVAYYVVTV